MKSDNNWLFDIFLFDIFLFLYQALYSLRSPITALSVFVQFLPWKTSIFDSVFMKAKLRAVRVSARRG